MWGKIGVIAAIITILGGLWKAYLYLNTKTLGFKLKMFEAMIIDWFDEIDQNLDRDLNLALLNNKEKKIHEFINSNLPRYRIKPTERIIERWNKEMGLKKELWNSKEEFQKYSRVPAEGMDIEFFFNMLIANFLRFKQNYPPKQDARCNFANIEMPIKFFKFYLKEKHYRG